MASLSSVSCQRGGAASSSSFVESLPHDVFSNVFGCLNRDEQLNASLVSKSFNQRIIDFPLAKLSLLAQLTQSLVDHLGQDRFGILQGIYERAIPKMDVGNLSALQNLYRTLKEQLIGVMKTFDEETLLSLKGAISPRLMNPFLKEGDSLQPRGGKCLAAHQLDSSANSAVNGRDCASSELFNDTDDFFQLAAAQKKIDQIQGIENPVEKDRSFVAFSREMTHSGFTSSAIKAALLTNDTYYRNEALRVISREFREPSRLRRFITIAHSLDEAAERDIAYTLILQTKKVNERISIAQLIENPELRNSAIRDICMSIAENPDKAIPMALSIPKNVFNYRDQALKIICCRLAEAGEIERAIEVSDWMNNKGLKSSAFAHVCTALIKSGDLYRALNIAMSKLDEGDKNLVLYRIYGVFFEARSLDKAAEIARLIPFESWRTSALFQIAQKLCSAGPLREAAKVAESIPDQKVRDFVLREISEAFIRVGDIDSALSRVRSMQTDRAKSRALLTLCRALIQKGDIPYAIGVAESIQYRNQQGYAYREIAKVFAEQGRTQEAITYAMRVRDKGQIETAFREIFYLLRRAGKLDEAVRVVNMIPDVEIWNFAVWTLREVLMETQSEERSAKRVRLID